MWRKLAGHAESWFEGGTCSDEKVNHPANFCKPLGAKSAFDAEGPEVELRQ